MKDRLKFLQIDTSNEDLLFIKLVNGEIESHILIREKRCHLKKLVPSISEILKENNLNLGDLDFIALNDGPGSWTGLRIGFSTVKIIAQVNNLKLVVYGNFEILENSNPSKDAIYLVPTNNLKYYYLAKSNGEVLQLGVISSNELKELYPTLKRFYYDEKNLNCNKLLISKFENKEFSDPMHIEPFYLVEGVIFNK